VLVHKKRYKIDVDLKERSYCIFVGNNILAELPQFLRSVQVNNQVAIISASPVSGIYLEEVIGLFNDDWYLNCYNVPDGEKSKSSDMVWNIYTWLLENQYERNSTIIALGGGVVGDLAGFVASTYLRGVNLVHIPTSLLAQVDSSVGGKVGINHPMGKNLIGAFYQPKCVFTDIAFLKTLPEDEYICGLGEVIKYGIISSEVPFDKIEENLKAILNKEEELLADIVQACVKVKADIVSKDEREQGIRAYLNLGHTFAHALETFYKYEGLKHGQAVLLGIKCALAVSRSLDMIDDKTVQRINSVIDQLGINIPSTKELDPLQLVKIMKRDKKMRDGKIHLVLPKNLGDVIVVPVTDEKIIRDSYATLNK
jgi:3-dehydroquinate synthase